MSKMSLTRTSMEEWPRVCVEVFGRAFPVNAIDETAVGFEVADGDPPMVMLNGDVVRQFYLVMDMKGLDDEFFYD